jgi:hypothetical protein
MDGVLQAGLVLTSWFSPPGGKLSKGMVVSSAKIALCRLFFFLLIITNGSKQKTLIDICNIMHVS